MLEQYVSEQQNNLGRTQRNLEVAQRISKNHSFLKSISDEELRTHNLQYMHKGDPILKKFKDIQGAILDAGPEVHNAHAETMASLMELRDKYQERTMTDDEFNFINTRSATDLIHDMFRRNNPGKDVPYRLKETYGMVAWGTDK